MKTENRGQRRDQEATRPKIAKGKNTVRAKGLHEEEQDFYLKTF